MVFDGQSDTNEDSVGRQIRVNKKLSKAISSVPRSRFIKPRPNVSVSKRNDSTSAASNARKSIEASQNTEVKSTSSEVKTNESLEKEKTIEASVINIKEIPQKKRDIEVRDIALNSETPHKDEDIITENDVSLITKETSIKKEEAITKSDALLNENETSQMKEQLITISETLLDTNDSFEKDHSSYKIAEKLCLDDKSEKSNTILNQNELLETMVDSNTTALNNEILPENRNAEEPNSEEMSQEEENRNIEETNADVSNLQEQSEIVPVSTASASISDRSSKYPHLTSILSKKRTEPKREVQHKKRKKFKKGDAIPERSKMTMADLIYWNPTNTNESSKSTTTVEEVLVSQITEEEENVDGDVLGENNICDSVPRLVISEDGQINIDQSSLIISRNVPQPTVTEVVRKDDTTYSSFRKRPLTKHWDNRETAIFYKALTLVGTDFGLMENFFPQRTRRELKQKFKREEKFNLDLVNKAIYESQLTFDAETIEDLTQLLHNLSDDDSFENAVDSSTSAKAKKTVSNEKQKAAKKSKSVEAEFSDPSFESLPNEVTSKRKVTNKRKRKAKKMLDFIGFDEIENTIEAVLEEEEKETISNTEEQDNKKKKRTKITKSTKEHNKKTAKQSHNDSVDMSAEIDTEGTDMNSHREITVNITKAVSQSLSLAVESESENDVQCIPVEYIENVDSTLLSNVMAFEVVTSDLPKTKKKQQICISKKNQQPFLPLLLSSTNYTPA